jgi:hypothetical protein
MTNALAGYAPPSGEGANALDPQALLAQLMSQGATQEQAMEVIASLGPLNGPDMSSRWGGPGRQQWLDQSRQPPQQQPSRLPLRPQQPMPGGYGRA